MRRPAILYCRIIPQRERDLPISSDIYLGELASLINEAYRNKMPKEFTLQVILINSLINVQCCDGTDGCRNIFLPIVAVPTMPWQLQKTGKPLRNGRDGSDGRGAQDPEEAA